MINLTDKKNCTGCYACANICPKNCIEMNIDNEGFKYPHVDKDKCIGCNLCEQVCPIINSKMMDNNPIAIACYNKNEDIRKESSSGGIFTLLAEEIIKNKGVVFGARFDENFNVIHDYTDNVEGISKFRGAKYVQSTIGNTYKQIKDYLNRGKKVLFSGTPCQIGGLKRYLQNEYENLICIDLICHGVPSSKAWNKYKEHVSKGKKIKHINFRNKTYGWESYSVYFKFQDGSEILSKGCENKYIRGFIGNIYLRPSCHDCRFKTLNRESDLTLADLWGVDKLLNDMNDHNGTSLVFVNSEKGHKIIKDISENIVMKEVDINEAVKYNLSAIKSSYLNPRRDYFFKKIDKYDFEKLVTDSLKEPLNIRIKVKIYKLLKFFVRK